MTRATERVRGPRLPVVVAIALGAAIVVAVAGVIAYRAWYDQQPPGRGDGPGVVRLTNPSHNGVPPPRTTVDLGNGSVASLSLRYADTENGRPTGSLAVIPPHGSVAFVALHEGERTTVGGVTVEAVHIWLPPNPDNHAVDVRVAAAP